MKKHIFIFASLLMMCSVPTYAQKAWTQYVTGSASINLFANCANTNLLFDTAGNVTCSAALTFDPTTSIVVLGSQALPATLTTGTSATTGTPLTITAASGGASGSAGGAIAVTGGTGNAAGVAAGGTITMTGGLGGTTQGNGGAVNINGGSAQATASAASGGAVNISGGTGGTGTTGNGGALTFNTGTASGSVTGNGGAATFATRGGSTAATTTANAGNLSFTTGNGGASATTTANGGNITFTAGNGGAAAATAAGGTITLSSGTGVATSQNGTLVLKQAGVNWLISDVNDNVISLGAPADQGFSRQTPATGFSITVPNNTSHLVLHPAGTLATGTVVLPSAPINGQALEVLTDQTITALTVSPNAGQTLVNAPTTLVAGTAFSYFFCTADAEWYRRF